MKAGAVAITLILFISMLSPFVVALAEGGDAIIGRSANSSIILELSPPRADENAPPSPTGLSATVVGSNIQLAWTAPVLGEGDTLTGYHVYRGTSSTPPTVIAAPGSESFIDNNVQRGVQYTYYVTSLNGTAESDPSNEVSATVPAEAPSAPTLNTATPGDGQVTLSWSAPDNGGSAITNYRVYRGTTSNGETFLDEIGPVLTFTDTGLTNGLTYYYKVSAVNAVDEGPLSNERAATPTASTTEPGAPTLNPATPGDGQVTLSWSAPDNGGSPITNYRIYRGIAPDAEILIATIGNVLTFTDTGLTNGLTYYYKVSAVNSIGEGDLSNERAATPTASITEPGAPTLNTATPGDGQVTLSWSAPSSDGGSAITNYRIYRGIAPDAEILIATIGNVLTFTDTGLTNGLTYYYKVSAVNAVDEGPLSNERAATPVLLSVPSAPTLNTATASSGQVTLAWTAPSSTGGSPITGYKVYRGTTSEGESLLANVGLVLTYTDTNVVGGQAYYYKVSAVNSVGEGDLSNEKSVTLISIPSMPGNLTLEPMDGDVSVSWTAPTNMGGSSITGYKVYRGSTEANLTQIGTTSGLFFIDTTTVKGSTYYFAVSAVNAAGEGVRSAALSITVPLSAVPSAPLDLKASTGSGKIVLTWAPPENDGGADITGYKVFRGTGPTMSIIASVTKTTYEDKGIREGVTYYYKVVAVNEAGDGKATDLIEVTAPKASVVDSPLGLVAIAGLAVAGVAAVLFLLRRSKTNP